MSVLPLLIGFMDEEVAPVLLSLVKKNKPVIVIERGVVTPDEHRLFEQPRSEFTGGRPFNVTVTGDSTTDPFVKALAKSLRDQDFVAKLDERSFLERAGGLDKEKLRRPRRADGRRERPKLSVIRFGSGPELPTVLVRAPEMGMQPSLVRPYLRLIVKALRTLLRPGDVVDLKSFGASGAIGESEAGTLRTLHGSVFVGATHNLLGDGKIRAQVAVATTDEHELLFDEEVDVAEEAGVVAAWDKATALAREYFLTHDIDDVDGMSLTLSYFGTKRDKDRGAELGLVSANTEDYHLFRVAQSMNGDDYPQLKGATIGRVDVDPPEISSKVVTAFQSWARKITLGFDDYVELLVWGARGFPMRDGDEIPMAAWWDFAEYHPELFGRYAPKIADQVCPLDPFSLEIAADLVKDAAEGRALPKQRPRLAALAKEFQAIDPDHRTALRRKAEEFVRELDLAGSGNVWARLGKWAGNTEPWLHTLDAEHVVDRAFYRSTNMVALTDLADSFYAT